MDKAWGIFQKLCVGLTVAGILLTPVAAASFYKGAATKTWTSISDVFSHAGDKTPTGAQ